MKKIFASLILAVILLGFAACSGKGDIPKPMSKEGIAPYELSESEKYLLRSFGMERKSHIVSFKAPEEAISLNANAYRLNGGVWELISAGGISISPDREPLDTLSGTFAMRLKENHAMDFFINVAGQAAYSTDEIVLSSEVIGSATNFLNEFQEIELNREIPVAIMAYDGGTTMQSFSVQNYFDTEVFEGMDLVQAVTLEFCD